jgi:hypothetical protein
MSGTAYYITQTINISVVGKHIGYLKYFGIPLADFIEKDLLVNELLYYDTELVLETEKLKLNQQLGLTCKNLCFYRLIQVVCVYCFHLPTYA